MELISDVSGGSFIDVGLLQLSYVVSFWPSFGFGLCNRDLVVGLSVVS